MTLPSIETVVIIGSGNVATHLARAIQKKGKKIIQIYSKHPNSAKLLSKEINTDFIASIGEISEEADLYILAISDNAIEEVCSSLKAGNNLIVHTSGTVSLDILKRASANFGVIYPLQTFSKDIPVDWKTIPILIEANNTENEKRIITFLKEISDHISVMPSEKRKILHLSAVFVNNFVNYLYTVAADIMKESEISFDYLKPLILETANKIVNYSPAEIQTGPAKRGDKKTIKEHLELLSEQKEYAELYRYLTKLIIEKHDKH